MAALAACEGTGGGDGGTGGPGGPTDPVVPTPEGTLLVGDLKEARYDAVSETLQLRISFDGADRLQAYTQNGAPLNGYLRFIQQNDPDSRYATAYARQSQDDSVQGTVALVGGQFNRYFSGAAVTQINYTAPPPEYGFARYTGEYVGLLNLGPVAPGATPGPDAPRMATPVTGQVRLDADFTDVRVNGSIRDRQFGTDGTGVALADIVLTVSNITGAGSFSGTVEFDDLTGIGTYSGVFGGQDAASVAGIVQLGSGFYRAPDGSVLPGATGTEQEVGIFVLTR